MSLVDIDILDARRKTAINIANHWINFDSISLGPKLNARYELIGQKCSAILLDFVSGCLGCRFRLTQTGMIL